MRFPGRHVLATATFASLLAFQFASPASAALGLAPGSDALTLPAFHHRSVGVPAPSQRVKIIYHLPLRNRAELETLTILQGTPGSQVYHHWLTPAQFRANFAPDAAHVGAAVHVLRAAGLSVDHIGSQLISVSAPAATIERAFSTRLDVAQDEHGRFVAARDSYRVPAALARLGGVVLGLSAHPRPQADHALTHARPNNIYGPDGPYYFGDLKQAYEFPSYGQANGGTNAYRRHIAIVGFSDFDEADAYTYFSAEGLASNGVAPGPLVTHNTFPGSLPFNTASGDSLEANLDVQQSGGSAPGAQIDDYASDSTSSESFLATYGQIVDDNIEDIVSTSYGGCELYFTAPYSGADYTYVLKAYNDIFLQGNVLGTTFIFSSGDNAGKPCAPPGFFEPHANPATYSALAGVSYWADDPSVTAVGGTNLTTTYKKGSLNSAYVSQQAIADPLEPEEDPNGYGNELDGLYFGSGGGQSVIWTRPSWQSPVRVNHLGGTGRLVPDISLHMGGCPLSVLANAPCLKTLNEPGGDSADIEVFGGQLVGVIGTSASAPDFAGYLAVLSQLDKNERRGNVNGLLYEAAILPSITQGIQATNGVSADAVPKGKLGYNVITGLGTPVGTAFIRRITGIKTLVPAGISESVTNP
jgi:subtilase family serine protease